MHIKRIICEYDSAVYYVICLHKNLWVMCGNYVSFFSACIRLREFPEEVGKSMFLLLYLRTADKKKVERKNNLSEKYEENYCMKNFKIYENVIGKEFKIENSLVFWYEDNENLIILKRGIFRS